MADVKIRNIDDWIVGTIRNLAQAHRRSLEEELRQQLREIALQPQKEFARRAAVRLDGLREQFGVQADSTALIREARDACD